MLRRCYRCRKELDEKYFEPPVTICIPCYSVIPGNKTLNYDELRAKARKARRGRTLDGRRQQFERFVEQAKNKFFCQTCKSYIPGEAAMNDDCQMIIKLDCGHTIEGDREAEGE